MAEQVAIPAGVNPANAVPPDATSYGSGNRGSAAPGAPGGDGGIPAVPPAAVQRPGHQSANPADGVSPAELAAFKAWQAQQAAAAEPKTVVPPTPKATPAAPADESVGPDAALQAALSAGETDPVISTTFEMFQLVAPDLDLARALGNAIDRGDATLIDRAYLREKGGDKADKLIKMAEGMVTHVNNQAEAVVADIHKHAGGEAQWDASTAVFNKSAPAYLKQYVVDALNSANPTKIRIGVAAVLEFVKREGGLPTAPTGHVRAGGGTPDASLGLSKQAYQEARQKLNRFDRNYNDQARELDARRQLGKKLGL